MRIDPSTTTVVLIEYQNDYTSEKGCCIQAAAILDISKLGQQGHPDDRAGGGVLTSCLRRVDMRTGDEHDDKVIQSGRHVRYGNERSS